jgi:VCBS repeat-containing protein
MVAIRTARMIFILLVVLLVSFSPGLLGHNAIYAQVEEPAGYNVTPQNGLVTDENGSATSFMVSLTRVPTADVTITLTSSKPEEGLVSPTEMLFTPADWQNAQTATVTGVDDDLIDGDQTYSIILVSSSSDSDYAGNDPPDVSVTNLDDDVVVVTVTANDDAYSTPRNQLLVVSSPGVLGNDTSTSNATMRANLETQPAHGIVLLSNDGSFLYTPTFSYVGSDSFTYTARVANATSSPATVTINIQDVNNPPVAQSDSYSTVENVSLNVNAANGVLANDSSGDEGQTLTAIHVSGPAHGSLTLNTDGSFAYTPSPGYTGGDQFTYKASDGQLESSPTQVALTITIGNRPPVARNDSYLTNATAANPLTVAAPGVLANDSDPEHTSLTASLLAQPSNGIVSLAGNGSFTYTPEQGFNGSASFTYQVTDAGGKTDQATATLNVDVNPPPPVSWVLPDISGTINHYSTGVLRLEVTVEPQVPDLDRVVFYRWDPELNQRVEIGSRRRAPYAIEVDVAQLHYSWNQIDAAAFDDAGNRSELRHIWVVREFPPVAFLPIIQQ